MIQTLEKEFIEYGNLTTEKKLDYLFVKFVSVAGEIKKLRRDTWISTTVIVGAILTRWLL
jgi:hypothetical protein